MKYESFVFKSYKFNKDLKQLELNYSLDNKLDFQEKYIFNFDFIEYNELALDQAFKDIFIISGISYFKTYIPKKIVIEAFDINSYQAKFFSRIYQKGLGEFFYVNRLDPSTKIIFPKKSEINPSIDLNLDSGFLIGIGGGKDSLVVSEALKNTNQKIATWSLNHKDKLEPLINRIGLKHYFVDREIDPKLLNLNKEGVLNGHVPISAIIGFVGISVAILTNLKDVVVGNEQTANDPSLKYRGISINHQYSKSQEYENDLINYLHKIYGSGIRYYSLLRPVTELMVGDIFSKLYFDKYKDVFSSCNRAFRLNSKKLFWCGECPKCAFIFLIFTPFIKENELVKLWNDKNLLLDPHLKSIYLNLLGINGNKPLDCVGEIKESRAAMQLAKKIYPELKNIYEFDLPKDYDYRKKYADSMPKDIKPIFNNFIAQF